MWYKFDLLINTWSADSIFPLVSHYSRSEVTGSLMKEMRKWPESQLNVHIWNVLWKIKLKSVHFHFPTWVNCQNPRSVLHFLRDNQEILISFKTFIAPRIFIYCPSKRSKLNWGKRRVETQRMDLTEEKDQRHGDTSGWHTFDLAHMLYVCCCLGRDRLGRQILNLNEVFSG